MERLAGVVVARAALPFLVPPFLGRAAGMPAKGSAKGQGRSPEQIARRPAIDFPDDKTTRISHEAIYQALFVPGGGVLRRELMACLRTGRVLRVPCRAGDHDQPASGRSGRPRGAGMSMPLEFSPKVPK